MIARRCCDHVIYVRTCKACRAGHRLRMSQLCAAAEHGLVLEEVFPSKVSMDGGGAKRFAGHTRSTGSTPEAGGRFESGSALADSQAAVLPSLPPMDSTEILDQADREHADQLARVPNAARLLAALNEAPWVDESAGRAVFAARVAARERANAAANYCEDLTPEVVTASLRRCGLVEDVDEFPSVSPTDMPIGAQRATEASPPDSRQCEMGSQAPPKSESACSERRDDPGVTAGENGTGVRA